MSKLASAFLVASLVTGGCGVAADDAAVPTRPQTTDEAAVLAATSALDSTALLQDIGDLIGNGFGGSLGGGIVFAGPPAFAPPAGCTAQIAIDPTHISLEHDCVLPSGRHVHGELHVQFGGDCGFGGLTVDFDLLVESQPGAGDEVAVKGHVGLKHGLGELYLATTLEHVSHLGGHDVQAQIGACLVLDLPERLLALDGVVSLDVDAELIALFRVSDLQHLLCDPIPYTGTLHVQHKNEIIQVVFDRDTPTTGVVTVITSAGTTQVKLPIPLGGWCSGGGLPVPAMIDYATCGGCGSPVPPMDPADPVIPPPPPVP